MAATTLMKTPGEIIQDKYQVTDGSKILGKGVVIENNNDSNSALPPIIDGLIQMEPDPVADEKIGIQEIKRQIVNTGKLVVEHPEIAVAAAVPLAGELLVDQGAKKAVKEKEMTLQEVQKEIAGLEKDIEKLERPEWVMLKKIVGYISQAAYYGVLAGGGIAAFAALTGGIPIESLLLIAGVMGYILMNKDE
jgi:hypothetical protein